MQATAPPRASAADVACALYAAFVTMSQRYTRDAFQTLAELGLSITQLKMLHLLAREPDDQLSVKALGEHLSLSLAAASRAVEALHQRGYVERAEDASDRRIKRVRLTDAGHGAIGDLHRNSIAAMTEFMATLCKTERQDLARALGPLLERLEVRPTPEGPA
jgi:DNA-binding MarR family transcriptional regulator